MLCLICVYILSPIVLCHVIPLCGLFPCPVCYDFCTFWIPCSVNWITCEWSALKVDFAFIFCLPSSAFGSTICLPCRKSLRVTLTHFLVDGFLRSCQKRAESFKNVTFLAWQTNWANTERQRFQWQINLNHISQRYQSKKKSYHLCSVV